MDRPIPKTKVCTSCCKRKAMEHFYVRRASKDGMSYICKKCSTLRIPSSLLEKNRKNSKPLPKTKVCNKCGKRKSMENFNKHKSCKYGREACCAICRRLNVKTWYYQYHQLNLERMNERYKEIRRLDPERLREEARDWYSRKGHTTIKKQVEELSDSYIARLLRCSVNDMPTELIEAKRTQIQIYRYLKNGN